MGSRDLWNAVKNSNLVINMFKFPSFQMFDPKVAEQVTKTGQEMLKKMTEAQDFSWFFKQIGNPLEP